MSTNREEYDKQIKRISKIYNQLDSHESVKFNVSFDELIGATPKHVTQKKLDTLKSITPAKVRAYADFIDMSSGETVNYTTWRKLINNPSTNYIPSTETNGTTNLSIIDAIASKIENTPDIVYTRERGRKFISMPMDFTSVRQELLGILYDNYNADEDGTYIRHLESNKYEINAYIDDITKKELYADEWTTSYVSLITLLNNGFITSSMQENASIYNEVSSSIFSEE